MPVITAKFIDAKTHISNLEMWQGVHGVYTTTENSELRCISIGLYVVILSTVYLKGVNFVSMIQLIKGFVEYGRLDFVWT